MQPAAINGWVQPYNAQLGAARGVTLVRSSPELPKKGGDPKGCPRMPDGSRYFYGQQDGVPGGPSVNSNIQRDDRPLSSTTAFLAGRLCGGYINAPLGS